MWVTSWWDETPWPEIREDARLILSPKQLREWLTRPDVLERMNREPLTAPYHPSPQSSQTPP
jgi:hypothetical protein